MVFRDAVEVCVLFLAYSTGNKMFALDVEEGQVKPLWCYKGSQQKKKKALGLCGCFVFVGYGPYESSDSQSPSDCHILSERVVGSSMPHPRIIGRFPPPI